jgi:hypothetical protein
MENIKQIIIIQKLIRGYLIRKHILIPSSEYQTKKWRQNRQWYKTGKSNECEKYQINLIERIINKKIEKTIDRINMETYDITNKKNPLTNIDGYEYTENFDGLIQLNLKYYFNLKFVCDTGGSQTRTLREVYNFIKCQLKYLLLFKNNVFFINIIDGDTCYRNMDKFIYLINKDEFKEIKKYIFIGSLYEFQKYLSHSIKVF